MSRNNLFWGTILLVVGAFFLARNMGFDFIDLRLLWPLLIILFGVYILIGRSWAGSSGNQEAVSLPLEGSKTATIKLEHGAGRVRISGTAPKGQLLAGKFDAMRLTSRKEGSNLRVKLSTAVEETFFWVFPWNWGNRREWDFSLNPDIPLSIKIETGASDNRLDFSKVQLTDLDIDTGASSTLVTMPAKAGHTRAEISGGAASFEIKIPEGVAASIRVESGLGSV